MNRPLTMTAEREAYLRGLPIDAAMECFTELDATRAALDASEQRFQRGNMRGFRDRALSELAEPRKALGDCREIITQSEMQCHHPADDGGPDCGNVDDCVYHALIEAIDAARAANGATEAK